MGFLVKLLKELNSARNEKFIALAVSLGLVAGFLPFFNIFTFVIFVLALILRIPFGLFLGSAGVFSVLGYFLDPLFHKFGYLILTSELFKPIFEYLYNLPLMRYSGFNNTIVMGALISGIIIGAVLYFVLSKFVLNYREIVFSYLSKYKILKWLVPEKIEKKGVFRISGLGLTAVIIGVVSLFFIFLFDPILKQIIEFSISKTIQKPVIIESLKTDFSNGEMNLKNIKINKTNIESINLKVSVYYLLWKKLKIDNLEIKNITLRKSIKELLTLSNNKNHENKKSAYRLNINIPKPSQLLEGYELKSISKVKKLKDDYENYAVYINEVKKQIKKSNEEIKKIKNDINELSSLSAHIKNLNDIEKIVTKTKKIKHELILLQTQYKFQQDKIKKMNEVLLDDIKSIKEATKEDYKFLSDKYNLLKQGKYYQFAQSFLKPAINKYVGYVVQTYRYIKPYLHSEKNNNEYIRGKGLYIKYEDKIKYPDFVLLNGVANFKLEKVKARVRLKNISDNQMLLNKRARIILNADSKTIKNFYFGLSYLNDVKFVMNIKKAYFKSLNIDNLIMKEVNLDLNSTGNIKNNEINLKVHSVINPKLIIYTKSKVISNALKDIKIIKISAFVEGEFDNYSIFVKSNIDSVLKKYMQKKINTEIEKNKKRLHVLLNQKINKEISSTGYNTIDYSVLNDINKHKEIVNKFQKELEKYAAEKLKKKILKKGLKDLIKF